MDTKTFRNPILQQFYVTTARYYRDRIGAPVTHRRCHYARVAAYKALLDRHAGARVERHAPKIAAILDVCEELAWEVAA